jgi:murein DD-endopeptidase MepM/ murein hydrolase activator NlpD
MKVLATTLIATFLGLLLSNLIQLAINHSLKKENLALKQLLRSNDQHVDSIHSQLLKLSSYAQTVDSESNASEHPARDLEIVLNGQTGQDRLSYWQKRLPQVVSSLRRVHVLLNHHKHLWQTIPDRLPTEGYLSGMYGPRMSPFTGEPTEHHGVDIGAQIGDEIHAAAAGTVKYAGYSDSFGKFVIIDHGYDTISKYAHASELFVRKGQAVKKGQKIAAVGSTGRSTGPHLHFEIWIAGKSVNPMHYLDAQRLMTDFSGQQMMGGEN